MFGSQIHFYYLLRQHFFLRATGCVSPVCAQGFHDILKMFTAKMSKYTREEVLGMLFNSEVLDDEESAGLQKYVDLT